MCCTVLSFWSLQWSRLYKGLNVTFQWLPELYSFFRSHAICHTQQIVAFSFGLLPNGRCPTNWRQFVFVWHRSYYIEKHATLYRQVCNLCRQLIRHRSSDLWFGGELERWTQQVICVHLHSCNLFVHFWFQFAASVFCLMLLLFWRHNFRDYSCWFFLEVRYPSCHSTNSIKAPVELFMHYILWQLPWARYLFLYLTLSVCY